LSSTDHHSLPAQVISLPQYIHTYIHIHRFIKASAKNRENESAALAHDD